MLNECCRTRTKSGLNDLKRIEFNSKQTNILETTRTMGATELEQAD